MMIWAGYDMPATIFGVVSNVLISLLGSMRSGLKPTWKSSPSVSPEYSSRIGMTISCVVPG